MAVVQILSNSIFFIEDEIFNSTDNTTKAKFIEKKDLYYVYFYYMTHLIIENGYDNI